MVYGASTDNNAVIMKKEQLAVLQAGDRQRRYQDSCATVHGRLEARARSELRRKRSDQNSDNIQAFVVSNDGMAGGVISALEKKGLPEKFS